MKGNMRLGDMGEIVAMGSLWVMLAGVSAGLIVSGWWGGWFAVGPLIGAGMIIVDVAKLTAGR